MQDLTTQIYAFCVTILTGFLLGIFFDIYRVVRGLIKPRKVIAHLGDLLFWIITTGFIFVLLLFGNWGELRLYVFIGAGLGVFLYLHSFSKLTVRILNFVIKILGYVKNLLAALSGLIINAILFPFRLIKSIIIIPIGLIGKAVQAVKKILARIFRFCIGRPANKCMLWIKRLPGKFFTIFERK